MIQRPRFKSCYHREILAPHGVLLLAEKGQFFLRGRAYLELAPLLDGERTTPEIVTRLEGRLSEAEILYALDLLEERGYIVDGRAPAAPSSPVLAAGPAAQGAFWELLGVGPEALARRKEEIAVSVRSLGAAPAAPFVDALRSLGLRVEDQGDLEVVLTDDYLREGLTEQNLGALSSRCPWMLVRPVGMEIWLGPVFVPGKTGCHACLAHCLAGHRRAEAYLRQKNGLAGPIVLARSALPSTVQAALGLAATEVAKWVVTGSSEALEGRLIAVDMASLQRTEHRLTRRPQCGACGDPGLIARGQQKPIELAPCPAAFTREGGYRRMSPEEMVARYQHLVSPITGVVGHVRRLFHKSGSDLTISYVADHNFAHVDEDLFFLHEVQRSRSGGKGKSDAQARASAIGEAIERYSGVFQGDEARIQARFADLGSAAIHPNTFMLYSERQIAERERWNRTGSRYTRVPAPLDPDRVIDWSPVLPLRGGEPRYLPTACCYFGYGRQDPSPVAYGESNGCAAGMTKEEAIFQGLLELCERDATAMWWYGRIRRPGVDLESFGDPYYADLLSYYRSIHREVWALDLTHDLGIPTFAALSRRTDKPAEDVIFGLGAHVDPRIALLRAVTELNQFLPAVLGVTAEAEVYRWGAEGVRFFKTATLETDPYLAPDESVPRRTLSDYPFRGTGDIRQDVLLCADALEQRGLQTLVLDQTRPETGMHVVRVIVPGMRHFWARFAPGRLYDVPVELGWLPRPLSEDELNPVAIFF